VRALLTVSPCHDADRAEGMGLQHEDDVLVAETAEDFASAVVRAYCDAGLWSRLATCGRRSILRRFSPDAVRPLLARCWPTSVCPWP